MSKVKVGAGGAEMTEMPNPALKGLISSRVTRQENGLQLTQCPHQTPQGECPALGHNSGKQWQGVKLFKCLTGS